ncbi:hypothetical protein N658DRAFT_521765 [Parathielavia hyrcaniae]|uniref:Apple domain-containing protein n=1 Tax=Parathielavia hyrcaniae TaxID=113614 RepID=A0AAN6T3Z2_9PEZI|nr:hypothetical protein N658DRAFT_521765 [Parathielavia hyrcaniae]
MRQPSMPSRAKAVLFLSLASASLALAAPLDCTDNLSDGSVYDSAAASYDILCGVDYAGGDVAAQTGIASFEECIELCDATSDCIDVSYAPSGTCWMKSTLGTPAPNGGIWTARNRITQITCEDNKSNGTIYDAAEGVSFQVLCGIDYAGGDLAATSETSFFSCMNRCGATEGCVDVSFVAPSCYMKSSITTAYVRGHVWTGKKVPKPVTSSTVSASATATDSSSATGTITETASGTASGSVTSTSSSAVPTSTVPSCVDLQSDNSTFTTNAGTVWKIRCGYEYYGGDLSLVGAPTFEDCIETCDWTAGCVDVSWVNGMCYMKQQLNDLVVATGVSTAEKVVEASWDVKPPLTCEEGAANGTTFKTDGGKFYEIFCGYDFPGGDFMGLSTASFEECLNACDENLECVDVAYVAPACYLKSVLAEPVLSNPAVWGAKAIADPGCEAVGSTMYPVANTDIDRSSMDNLVPSLETTLNYAEKQPGTKAASLFLTMLSPQITLENTDLVSVTCSEGTVVVDASTAEVQEYIMSNWPASGLVLFTNSVGCNNETSRGIYRTTGAFATMGTQAITFLVTVENFATVASEVAIKYGAVKRPSPDASPSTTQYYSTCFETGAATTLPGTATTTATGAAQTTLSPGALNLLNALKAAVQYDEDGNVIMHPKNEKDVELVPNPYDPDNMAEQEALEEKFREWGVDDPSTLGAQGDVGAKGVCSAPTKTTNAATARRLLPKPRRRGSFFGDAFSSVRGSIAKRFGWDDIKAIGCDDLVGDIVGEVNEGAGAALGLACAANDIYENREGYKCLFTGCYTTTTIITYYTPPPATKYNFDYSWRVTYPALKQAVRSMGPNKVLSCDNCGFSISNIQFSGQIVINMTAGAIKEATITAGISGAASMVAGLKSDGAWNGEWSYTYSNSELGAITLDNAFNIVPTVLYGIGVNYNTDAAVSTSGGAQFNLNNAAVSMDLLSGNILSQQNWAPQITFTNPTFTTGTNIQLTPYMRWAVNLAVNIYGQVALSPTITSETVVGLGSSYSFSAQASCPANNLLVTSYVSTKNRVSNGRGLTKVLHSEQQYNSPKCYNVPSNQPSPDDMMALSASGQEYCTSYINYRAPTVYQWSTYSVAVPSTATSFTTTTVTSTPTITVYPTTTLTTYYTYTSTASTVYVTATTDTSFPSEYMKKRSDDDDVWVPPPVSEPMTQPVPTVAVAEPPSPAAALRFDRRAVAPAVVSGWPASKLSYACSQVATGKITVTSTATSTTTSGVTVLTQTRTANAQGPLSTVTNMQSSTVYGGFTTATAAGPTTVTQYSCPMQTQASCLRLQGHGPPHIDGRYLGYSAGSGSASFDPRNRYDVWYLSCKGELKSFFRMPELWTVGGMPNQGYFMVMGPSWTPATCVKNTDSRTLECALPGDPSPLMILPASYAVSGYGYLDSRVNMPLFGTNHRGSEPIALTYEETECPCVWG